MPFLDDSWQRESPCPISNPLYLGHQRDRKREARDTPPSMRKSAKVFHSIANSVPNLVSSLSSLLEHVKR